MPPKPKDITGLRFGRLIALRRIPDRKDSQRHTYWECLCTCGKKVQVQLGNLTRGQTQSCGCITKTQGGLSRVPGHARTWSSYKAMVRRCTDTSHPFYKDYGGRGICVYFDWLGDGGFKNFLKAVGPRPPGKTIDREDPDGNYEPGNVRWATGSEQRMNQRRMK